MPCRIFLSLVLCVSTFLRLTFSFIYSALLQQYKSPRNINSSNLLFLLHAIILWMRYYQDLGSFPLRKNWCRSISIISSEAQEWTRSTALYHSSIFTTITHGIFHVIFIQVFHNLINWMINDHLCVLFI